jgi:hypothetical protein
MHERTIRRWDGKNGTMYKIEITLDGGTVHEENCKHADAVETLRDEFGITDAEAVVYNASQSSRAYEF